MFQLTKLIIVLWFGAPRTFLVTESRAVISLYINLFPSLDSPSIAFLIYQMSPYCRRCDRPFINSRALDQHLTHSSSHNICYDCEIDFSSWKGLKEHYVQSPKHNYCQYCDRHFVSHKGKISHWRAKHAFCDQHYQVFKSYRGLHEHYRQKADHYYCVPCKELFDDEDELDEHKYDYHGLYW